METIKVTVSSTGGVKIEAEGFTNNTCLSATEPLRRGLGMEDAKTVLKPEAHIQAEQTAYEYEQ